MPSPRELQSNLHEDDTDPLRESGSSLRKTSTHYLGYIEDVSFLEFHALAVERDLLADKA